ncbi:MAG: hypothetical protein M0P71_06260 [Melioribacteraceae bacterium]|nr:hypothetical protein [Melioribacteraceae bacterium]
MKKIITLLLLLTTVINAQLITPIEKNNYTKLTSYDELFDYAYQTTLVNSNIELSPIAVTNGGYIIPALFISSDKFGEDKNKVRVMVFAQQHGNEQSGKEGMLLLLKEIANGKHNRFFDKIDLILIPQVNPEGSQANKRRNNVGADLNRNHLILTMSETIGLHRVFNKYLPEVTLDIHEYYPYSEEWEKLGYRKNYDEQIGIITNINVSQKIRDEQRNSFLPYILTYIRTAEFTANEYLLGGPPGIDRMRYSTVDIDDGRQSFGILNSFSIIFEGLNGIDSLSNMKRRATGQKTAVLGLLQYVYENASSIKSLVSEQREKLINGEENKCVIQMEHFSTNDSKDVTFYSVKTDRDTLISVPEFHDSVKPVLDVNSPAGYLIPKSDTKLYEWIRRHNIEYTSADSAKIHPGKITYYEIKGPIKKILEEAEITFPELEEKPITNITLKNYYYISVKQLHNKMLTLALEPQSQLGLSNYQEFNYLKRGNKFTILRVNN